jgi:hypothetical protein
LQAHLLAPQASHSVEYIHFLKQRTPIDLEAFENANHPLF